MKLAVVTGQIVCTVRHQGLAHDKLLMVEMIDAGATPTGSVPSLSTVSGREPESGYCWSAAVPHASASQRIITGRSVRHWHRR
ncbi:hypothetical protein IVU49_19210 [Salmonella enterica subsp. enterica serovar Worthington]|nr:hypothetical protein [Salmonella enterica subsp. enterica serovar Worthington]MBP1522735.1 hypothetical protein [Salmonella enterica subsp. enterica serovar Worthington]MBP1523128.1 hypothetical protein [Salmonella enterica subsp. enterica serovar Worthington]MBP1523203.1 hypothetical protein [Salmonella enterica subsp. enterica serovar Worthington]